MALPIAPLPPQWAGCPLGGGQGVRGYAGGRGATVGGYSGGTFWLNRNRLVGSYRRLIAASRA